MGQPDNVDWSNHEWGGWEDYLGINYEGVGKWNDYPPKYTMGTLCQYDPTASTTEIEGRYNFNFKSNKVLRFLYKRLRSNSKFQ